MAIDSVIGEVKRIEKQEQVELSKTITKRLANLLGTKDGNHLQLKQLEDLFGMLYLKNI